MLLEIYQTNSVGHQVSLGCVWCMVQHGTGQNGTRVSRVWHVPKWDKLELSGTHIGHASPYPYPWNTLEQTILDQNTHRLISFSPTTSLTGVSRRRLSPASLTGDLWSLAVVSHQRPLVLSPSSITNDLSSLAVSLSQVAVVHTVTLLVSRCLSFAALRRRRRPLLAAVASSTARRRRPLLIVYWNLFLR